jgi:hypothetical protein
MKQKDSEQKNHDKCVSIIAEELKKDKWDVKADLRGWEKPSERGGLRPDIEAKKDCLVRICEVVTEGSLKTDKIQLLDLQKYCEEYDFHMYIVDKNGKRKLIDPKTLQEK